MNREKIDASNPLNGKHFFFSSYFPNQIILITLTVQVRYLYSIKFFVKRISLISGITVKYYLGHKLLLFSSYSYLSATKYQSYIINYKWPWRVWYTVMPAVSDKRISDLPTEFLNFFQPKTLDQIYSRQANGLTDPKFHAGSTE